MTPIVPGLKEDREFKKRAEHCIEGTWGAQVVDELRPRNNDVMVTKRRFSGFFETDLDLTLKDLQVDTVIVMGVVTISVSVPRSMMPFFEGTGSSFQGIVSWLRVKESRSRLSMILKPISAM